MKVTSVQPGQLIKATDMNDWLETILSLEKRVTALETRVSTLEAQSAPLKEFEVNDFFFLRDKVLAYEAQAEKTKELPKKFEELKTAVAEHKNTINKEIKRLGGNPQ